MAQRYVNTASTPGGDGTTNATAGANRAYASLSEWEAARQGVLAAIETVDCTGSTADTTSCTIDGSTTTASFYHQIRAASGQEATMPWSTSRYRLSVNGNVLLIQDDHVRVERIQAETIDTSSNRTVFYIPNANAKIIKCLVRYGTSNQHVGYDFRNGGIAENCVCIGNGIAGSLGFTSSSGSGTMHWYNCTAINCGINFDFQGTTTVLKNCLGHGAVTDSTSDFVGTPGAGSTNNASEDATASGTNARASQTFTFVNAGTGDYHLASGDAGAKDFGTSLAADGVWPFSTDFDGATRSGSWDIGADETAGAAAFSITAEAGAFTVTGTAAGLLFGREVAADPGAYTIAGTAASLELGSLVTADPGAYAITGTAAQLLVTRLLTADPGAVVVTGTAAGFLVTMVAQPGAYLITGTDAELRVSGAFSAEPGAVVIAGTDADLRQGRGVTAEAGAVTVTGTEAGLLWSRLLAAFAGAYVITGTDAALSWSEEVPPEPSQTADPFARSRTHTATARTFAWTAPERD